MQARIVLGSPAGKLEALYITEAIDNCSYDQELLNHESPSIVYMIGDLHGSYKELAAGGVTTMLRLWKNYPARFDSF